MATLSIDWPAVYDLFFSFLIKSLLFKFFSTEMRSAISDSRNGIVFINEIHDFLLLLLLHRFLWFGLVWLFFFFVISFMDARRFFFLFFSFLTYLIINFKYIPLHFYHTYIHKFIPVRL